MILMTRLDRTVIIKIKFWNALKTLCTWTFESKLVWNCLLYLKNLAHQNEMTDVGDRSSWNFWYWSGKLDCRAGSVLLAFSEAQNLLVGSLPLSLGRWSTSRNQTGLKPLVSDKLHIIKLLALKVDSLIQLRSPKLRTLTGLLTGYCLLNNYHLHRMGFAASSVRLQGTCKNSRA